MEEKSEKKDLSSENLKQDSSQGHFPEDSHAPEQQAIGNDQSVLIETSADNSTTGNQQHQTKDMEVHKHPHHVTHKKKWGEYLLEFFMLFLAVFLGFLAENQREHIVEHQREKKYAETLLEDLINDTIKLKSDIPSWESVVNYIDTVRNEIEKEPSARNSLLLYRYAALLITNNTFTYHDRTIGQLKNSGNFRLIQKSIADSLIGYDARVVSLRDLEERYTIIYFQNREVLQEQLFNSKFFALRHEPEALAAAAKQEPGIIKLGKGKEDILFQYYNSLFALKYQTIVRGRILRTLFHSATNLIGMIKKDYHLE